MTITINKKKIELKYSLRSLMLYENIAEKSFLPQTLTDVVTYFYCVVVTSANDYTISFEDSVNILDNNPDYMSKFGDWMNKISENTDQLKKK